MDDRPVVVRDAGRGSGAVPQVSKKEAQKLRRKEIEAAMAEAEAKKAAVANDDDRVFDVSYEATGMTEEQLANATDIKVSKLTIRAKGKLLLEDTALTIANGRRYGLVGPNGQGKSTLLKMIAKRSIPVPASIDVLMVEQEIVGDDRTALQAVVEADVELMRLRAEEDHLQRMMNDLEIKDEDKTLPDGSAYDHDTAADLLNGVYEQMDVIGGSSAEARASKILHGLGFTPTMQGRSTKSFSGGWRMRISLARALYVQPTLLLLDEPTNHLDLRAALWLEEYLQRYKKTLIVVSHDRYFLNEVTTDIIHLHDFQLHQYRGNFEQFEGMYEQKRREVNKEYEKFAKQMKAAKQTGGKAAQKNVEASAKKKAESKGKGKGKKQAAGMDAADDVVTAAPRKWHDYSVRFDFPEPTLLPPPLMQLNDVSFKYPGREDFGMRDLNVGIDMGSRICIVGPNGAGKTTLMNLLSGDLEPTEGFSRRDPKLRIGRYNQHFVDALTMDETPVSYLMNKFPELGYTKENMRGMLGRFGLSGAHHLQPILKLSGGQKARVVFTAIALSAPHILLLDEPTNHLDMQSIDALADAIEEFEGGVVIISHDSRLLSSVCEDVERSEVWIVDDGTVTPYKGDFEDYKDELIKEIVDELEAE
ncbi:unnamed protein product [Pedinophyceae sp. YPF-701]|nr:unnamed protein product [Pedinophyceae sp. YPF-701]